MDGNFMVDRTNEARNRELVQQYLNILDDSAEGKIYVQKVEDMISTGTPRLIVNLNDVRKKSAERAAGLIHNFVEEIICLEQAAKEMIQRASPDFVKTHEVQVGFEGSFGDRHVNPRSLKANFLGNLVCCEGIVTKCSAVRPKVVKSVHYCPATKKTLEKRYTDLTSYESFPSSNVYPTEDENKNPLETEFGLSTYKDHQSFSVQELPECAPAGQLPRSIDVIADNDLADLVNPGDRVRIIGLYRVLPNKQNGYSNGSFRSIVISNNIQLLSKESTLDFDPEDVRNIRKLSRKKDVFELIARSLAPSICGHDEVKKAILCLLLGGCEKILDNGSRLRGDINVLLIGDPSVAKSQLLRYVLQTAPRAIATTGRGSSGVGLTAAVTTDTDTGERRLEAGAMVLADRGVVCIDEFDKMSDIDRTAIHEVMEQGRVTIAKAGIHAKLNARCSVLAAANPVYGRYDPFKTPMDNINMQDSLLSRFDLIFVLLDEHDPDRDNKVASHVLKLHCYRAPGEEDGTVLPMGAAVETMSTFDLNGSEKSSEMYEKNSDWVDDSQKVLSVEFVRKYIHLARSMKPKLTEGATEYISEVYSEIRSFDTSKTDRERTMPITARQLETLIRLATSIAKARFSKTVDKIDAEKAYNLLHFACFKEKPKARLDYENAKKKGVNYRSDDEQEEEEEMDQTTATATTATPGRGTRRRARDETIQSRESSPSASQQAAKRPRAETPSISVDRYKQFRSYVRKVFDEIGASDDMVDLAKITEGKSGGVGCA
ncbi:MCM2/3/5 family protein [Ancylostoma caninum]|uniref:DNA replication licensing factor MCM3 n=2 Tax=Strongyloidea TaxID=27829 RepID=A0A368GCV9_ANCCA|nr:MCM2/3/5 family protein [Ancylostoma caninum]